MLNNYLADRIDNEPSRNDLDPAESERRRRLYGQSWAILESGLLDLAMMSDSPMAPDAQAVLGQARSQAIAWVNGAEEPEWLAAWHSVAANLQGLDKLTRAREFLAFWRANAAELRRSAASRTAPWTPEDITEAIAARPKRRPVWGRRWASGQGAMVVGWDGSGKTTLALSLTLGLLDHPEFRSVLGETVTPLDGELLYLALDRPSQWTERFQSMVSSDDVDRYCRGRLKVEFQVPPRAKESAHSFADWVVASEARVVVLDNARNVFGNLAETGRATEAGNAASLLVAEGVEVLYLNHPKDDGSIPLGERGLDHSYGGSNVYHGLGTVVSLRKMGQSRDGARIVLREHKLPTVADFEETKALLTPSGQFRLDDHKRQLIGLFASGARLTVSEVVEQMEGTVPEDATQAKAAKDRWRSKLEAEVSTGKLDVTGRNGPLGNLYHLPSEGVA